MMPPTVIVPSKPPSCIDSDLRSRLTTALLTSSVVHDIHKFLLSSCKSTGWLEKVRERTLQLLRNGDCVTYDEVLKILIAEARGKDISKDAVGHLRQGTNERLIHEGGKQKEVDIRIPKETIAPGVEVVRKALDKVVKIESSKGS